MKVCYAIDLDVLRTLRRSGPMLFEDLAARIGGDITFLDTRLSALRTEGLITYTPRRGWSIKESN